MLFSKLGNIQNSLIQRSANCISTELEGEAVILNLESGIYSSLNEVGNIIWQTIERFTSFEAIVATIVAEFNVTQEACEEDLLYFLEDMKKNGLIVLENN